MVWSHSLTVYWQCMLLLIDILQGMPVMNTRNILNCARYRQFHVQITVSSSTCCSNSLKTFCWNNKTTCQYNYRQLPVYSTDFDSYQQINLFLIETVCLKLKLLCKRSQDSESSSGDWAMYIPIWQPYNHSIQATNYLNMQVHMNISSPLLSTAT